MLLSLGNVQRQKFCSFVHRHLFWKIYSWHNMWASVKQIWKLSRVLTTIKTFAKKLHHSGFDNGNVKIPFSGSVPSYITNYHLIWHVNIFLQPQRLPLMNLLNLSYPECKCFCKSSPSVVPYNCKCGANIIHGFIIINLDKLFKCT